MGDRFETVVIGGGQAGLAAGYFLSKLRQSYLIVDANSRIGDAWRMRWDSLRLFTPASIDQLPGMSFPTAGSHLPTKDEMADYLEAYALTFDLPIRLQTKVDHLRREDDRFVMVAGSQSIEASNVIVATGAHQLPRIPAFANQLHPRIAQLHSATYRNPDQLPPGPVLVVGVGNSGAEIARELGPSRPTWLAGRDVGYIRTGSGPLANIGYQLGSRAFAALGSLNSDSWLGRGIVSRLQVRTGGDPVIGMGPEDLANAGVQRRARVAGVEDGLPRFDDGSRLEVKTVIWCTGFRRDFQWIRALPAHHRGVAGGEPGLYFVGLPYQSSILSGLVAGASGDAQHVVEHLAKNRLNVSASARTRAQRSEQSASGVGTSLADVPKMAQKKPNVSLARGVGSGRLRFPFFKPRGISQRRKQLKRKTLTPSADIGLPGSIAQRARPELRNRLRRSMFCAPRGLLGKLGGGLMAMDKETGAWVLDLLEISPTDAVLEIGSGPGVALELAAKRLPQGRIVGVDVSQTMVEMARHRNHHAIEVGRVEVKLGTADDLPFGDATFDAALTINSLHIWTDPVAALREIRRTMRPGGRIAVAISRFSRESSETFTSRLTDAGFEKASLQLSDHGHCAIAHAPIA